MYKRGSTLRAENVVTFLLVLVIAGIAIMTVNLFGNGLTGLVIENQGSQADFDFGTYNNTLYDGSALVLSENETSGDYISKLFDGGEDVTWNSISFETSELDFESFVFVDSESGFWSSSDSGVNFNLLKNDYNDADSDGATALAKNSSDSLFVLDNQALWVSTNFGNSWTKVNSDYNANESDDGKVMEIDSSDNIYVIESDNDIWTSSNAGANFTKVDSDLNTTIVALTSHSGTLFAVDSNSEVLTSSNAGVTWTSANSNYDSGNSTGAADIFADSSGNLFIINDDLWTSNDAGVTWTLVNSGINGITGYTSNNIIYVIDDSGDLSSSDNSGVNFTLVSSDVNSGNGQIVGLSSVIDSINLAFQVKTCSDVNCSNSSGFIGPDETSNTFYTSDSTLNIVSQYFQYMIFFSEENQNVEITGVNVEYNLLVNAPQITLFQPTDGNYDPTQEIPLSFAVYDYDGDITSCWYTLNGDADTELTNCDNSSLDLVEYTYDLIVYVEDSEGQQASDSVTFVVDGGNDEDENIDDEEASAIESDTTVGGEGGDPGSITFPTTSSSDSSSSEEEVVEEVQTEEAESSETSDQNAQTNPFITGFAFMKEFGENIPRGGYLFAGILAVLFVALGVRRAYKRNLGSGHGVFGRLPIVEFFKRKSPSKKKINGSSSLSSADGP
ncbi:MAG: hypothetical protein WDZ77_01990 [Candidatus Pacearchaeota archaeon]